MFNLLPKTEKDAIRREYRRRLFTVILWGIAVSTLVASLLLIPSFVLSRQREEAASARVLALSRRADAEKSAQVSAELAEVSTLLTLLATRAPTPSVFDVVRTIAAKRPPGVSFENIAFAPFSQGTFGVQISGVAENRAALVAFNRALETAGTFTRVELPLSNLAKSEDITFSINVMTK